MTPLERAKQKCAGVYHALGLDPGSWKEEVLSGASTCFASTPSSFYVFSRVAPDGEYEVSLRRRKTPDEVFTTLMSGSCADYNRNCETAMPMSKSVDDCADMATPSPRPTNLAGQFDAQVWATEWARTIRDHPGVPFDDGAMIGWFSNAIMAGFDEKSRRIRQGE